MQRPAIMNLARTVDRRVIGLGLVGLLTLTVGYVGQGSWEVGASIPSSANAMVTDVVGGAGSRKPVRVKVSLAVTNGGTEQIRVVEAASNGNGTAVLGLSPSNLLVEPGVFGRIDADVTLDCDRSEPLRLPDLQLELRDGTRQGLQIGGSGMLLEACSRAEPGVRPLTASILPPTSTTDNVRLAVRLSSPSGRRINVLAIRAGGAVLQMPSTPMKVVGKIPVVVLLAAPKTCPIQWQVAGIPSALTADVVSSSDTPGAESSATVRLRLGPALTSWLLATACSAAP